MGAYLSLAAKAVVVLAAFGGAFAAVLLKTLYNGIPPLPPTKKQLDEENYDENLLLRYVPALKGKVAWRQLGNYPTPIHKAKVGSVSFYVKREDLASERYGGNKVRTLQHQIASAEAIASKTPDTEFFILGSGGSNQVVATSVYGTQDFGLNVKALWAADDKAEIDNTLNMLSVLSLPVKNHTLWTQKLQVVAKALHLITSSKAKGFNLGGNNVTGILGQICGALELAEQIQRGEVPDPEAIYLAVGSSCTVTGLMMGVVIARNTPELNKAFRRPDFKIMAVPIHHAFAALHRHMGFFKSYASRFVTLTPLYGISKVSAFIRESGGPDYQPECERFFKESVEYITDPDIIGLYGGHSDRSLAASKEYDQSGAVFDEDGNRAKDIWLCGHFASKPFAALMEKSKKEGATHKDVIFWQTKSAVQPLGELDEFSKLKSLAKNDKIVKQWIEEGKDGYSSLREGSIDLKKGPETYRHLMTPL